MALGKIDDVDVVTHRGAIGCGVVASEHADLVETTDRNLHHVRNEVVGNAVRVFADRAGCMGAHRVEVAKEYNVEIVGGDCVPQDLLAHVLRPAVGTFGAGRRSLGDWDFIRLPVHGARR